MRVYVIVVAVAVVVLAFARWRSTSSDRALVAAARGDLAAVKRELWFGLNVNGFDRSGQTLLMHAASSRQAHVVRGLLKMGADPNQCDRGGWSPVSRAAFVGDVDAVRALLAAGADPVGTPVPGFTVERVARVRGYPQIASLLCAAEAWRPGSGEGE
jgi:uncharacterized protein